MGVQFPLVAKPVKTKNLEEAGRFEEELARFKSLPRNRVELLEVLEGELDLTSSCLSSYIEFKREALSLVYAYNYENVQEEDNLETQSSLDGDDEKLLLAPSSSALSQDNNTSSNATAGTGMA